jgi:hypothetical protein
MDVQKGSPLTPPDRTLEAVAARVQVAIELLDCGDVGAARALLGRLEAVLPEATSHNLAATRASLVVRL